MKHTGDLVINNGNKHLASELTEVTGGLGVHAECDFPVLAKTGGLYVHAECYFPKLVEVTDLLGVRVECDFPVLAKTGWLAVHAECEFSVLSVCYDVKGRLIGIARNGYALWLGDDGLWYCGCKKLTRTEAVDRWSKMDDIAKGLVEMIERTAQAGN